MRASAARRWLGASAALQSGWRGCGSGVRRRPSWTGGRYRRAVVMDAVFAAAAERRAPTLVLTGRRATARYRVRAVAVP